MPTTPSLSSPPIPDRLDDRRFTVVPLTPELVDLDVEAYVNSPDAIRAHSDGRWPTHGFSRDDDLPLLERHWSDHQAGAAFAYAVLDPARTRSLGCVYVNPLDDYLRRAGAGGQTLASYAAGPAAMVTYWIRQDRAEELSGPVANAIEEWLSAEWLLMHLWRVLPAEQASVAALDRLPLERVDLDLPAEPRPYLWYRSR